LNKEKDKLAALLSQMQKFDDGTAVLGIPSVVVSETVTLSDGTAAEERVIKFLDNPYVVTLQATQEVALKSSHLQFRFDTKRMPELREKAIAAGLPKDNANKLKRADADVLATALVYKAARLTTYDPFLLFIGKEYITPETGLVVDLPDTSWLPLEYPPTSQANTPGPKSSRVLSIPQGRKFR
jgi:hypothetical protein